MNKAYLIKQFGIAKANKTGICVEHDMPGQKTTEKIINDYEALDNKLNYYLENYDDLLVHNRCCDIIITDVYPCDFYDGRN